jgi:hypothetical protein
MARRAEEQAAQDTRFQEMMDRIAELEGQLATPTPSSVPEPEPFVPGGPFPGIPDFIRDLDFSGLPNFDIDYDDLMDQYRDRMEMGEPEPIESFLPDPRDLPPMGPMGMPPAPAPTPIDLQAMFEEGKPISKNMYPDFVPDRTTDRFNQIQTEKKANQVLQTKRSNAGTEEILGDGRIRITDRDGNVTFKEKPTPAPAPVYTPPPQMSKRPMIPDFGRINLR